MKINLKIIVMGMFLSASSCTQAMDIPTVLALATPVMAGVTGCMWYLDNQNVKSVDDQTACSFKQIGVNGGGLIALTSIALQGVLFLHPYDENHRITMLTTGIYGGTAAAGLIVQSCIHSRLNKQLVDQGNLKKLREESRDEESQG